MTALLWLVGAAWAQEPACSRALTGADVLALAQSVERRLIEDNGATQRAHEAQRAMVADLVCVREPLSSFIAAVVLQVRGFTAFFDGDPAEAHRNFVSARIAVPDIGLSPELAPYPAHPMARAWGEARWDGGIDALPPPAEGVWFVNGRASATIPRDLPVVLQLVRADGTARSTAIVDEPPAPVAPPPPVVADARPVEVVRPGRGPAPLSPRRPFPARLVTGLAVGLAGGAMMVHANATRSERCDLPDANGDGHLDCPSGVLAQFWGGAGAATAGGSLAAWGIATELTFR